MTTFRKNIDIAKGITAAALAVLFMTSACASGGDKVEIRRGEFVKTVMISGSLQAERSQQFAAPLTDNWRIQVNWMLPEGQSVVAGDPVVRFDTANLGGEIEKSKLDLQSKKEEIKQKKADLTFQHSQLLAGVQQAEVERQKRSIDAAIPQELITRYEYDQNQLNLKRAEQELAKKKREEQLGQNEMQTQLAIMELDQGDIVAKLQRQNRQLESMTLRADRSGTVIYGVDPYKERKVQPGDTVTATTVVAEIPEAESLFVESWASESDLRFLKTGQAVDLILDTLPDKVWGGTIHQVVAKGEHRRVWGTGNLFRIIISMKERDLSLMRPGMSVRCEVPVMKVSDAWLVPLALVRVEGEQCWIKRAGMKMERVKPLGINEFMVALAPTSLASDQRHFVRPIQDGDVPEGDSPDADRGSL
jgi:hypothetical protein